MQSDLDISKNRESSKYSRSEQLRRILWALCTPLFRYSPRPMFGWRNWLLRLFGARVEKSVNIYGSATISMPWNLELGNWSSIGEHAYIYNLGKVSIGEKVTVSQRAHLCAGTHDYKQTDMPLLKPEIKIADQSWVCADAFVGPGVNVGEGAVLGARSVIVKDIESWHVVAGNPAKTISIRELSSAGDL